jgi:hypothetical protein
VVNLVTRADFTPHGSSAEVRSAGVGASDGSASPSGASGSGGGSHITTSTISYGVIFAKELGIVASLLAVVGLLASLRRRRSIASYPLLITFMVNLSGAAAEVGPGSNHGFNVDLSENGFVLGCYFVLACWCAIGATELVAAATERSRFNRPDLAARTRFLAPAAAVLIGVAVLVPSVSSHWKLASRAAKPFADRYAATVFGELPPRAALFVSAAELTQPLIYRQVVDHQRRDVTVIAADGLSTGWYREQLARRLGQPLPPLSRNHALDVTQVVHSLMPTRPVYLDPQTDEDLKGYVPYRPVGILSQPVRDARAASVRSPAALERSVLNAESAAGMPDQDWDVWPNNFLASSTYSTAALMVARAYYDRGDKLGMRRSLLNVLRIEPQNQAAQQDLNALDRSLLTR